MITIELCKEDMKFSAGHFTIFDADRRERLHGHNFTLSVALTCTEMNHGLVFDYGEYKLALRRLCRQYDSVFLLPGRSPHLQLRPEGEYLHVEFAGKALRFLQDDALILPVENVTVESLAGLLLEQIVEHRTKQGHEQIVEIVAKVYSGPGQCGVRRWSASG